MQMKYYSYHIFMFPFRWAIKGRNDDLFSEQINLESIEYCKSALWKRVTQLDELDETSQISLYNEGNYFYKFVHDALYDNGKSGRENLVRHYERTEPLHGCVKYIISTEENDYALNVENICVDLFSTGVGVLIFYLGNDTYADCSEILKINQYGRRVYPPFYNDKNLHLETACSLEIQGLIGEYKEDFSTYTPKDINKPAVFITKLINEVATNISIETVIDDRMYVMSWYRNKELAQQICAINDEKVETGWVDDDDKYIYWYKYVFVDSFYATCRNVSMLNQLIKDATYRRWQGWGSLYGISRYSFVMLSSAGDDKKHLYDYFETEYVRMAELILVQKASILKFSQEVTNISALSYKKKLFEKVDSLYKEYIRFVNQIHFREVSAQDQAIELYQLLYKQMDIGQQVEKLDDEIDELHTYVQLSEDRTKSELMDWLTIFGGIALPATILTGFFGMNNNGNGAAMVDSWEADFTVQWISILLAVVIMIMLLYYRRRK